VAMTWDEMFAYREALEKNPAALKAMQKIGKMHRLHGTGPEGRQCRDCTHFFYVQHAKSYPKCELFGVTGGPGTDWRARFAACGKFEEAPKEGA
jgi:hypothetical protein